MLFICGSFVVFAFLSISSLKTERLSFEHSKELISDKERFEQILQEPLYSDGDVNSLLWRKLRIEEIINSLAPNNAFSLCVEYGFYILPLIMTVIGAMTVFLDMSSHVMRIRIAREGKWRYFISKQAMMLTLAVALTFVSIILYMVMSHIFFDKATAIAASEYINISDALHADPGEVILQALFLIVCLVIFLEIGFSLSYISKTPVVPVVFIGLLWFFNIIPTAYEPKNAIYNIATRLSDFYGPVPNEITANISLGSAVLIVSVMFIIPISTTVFFWQKKSAYK